MGDSGDKSVWQRFKDGFKPAHVRADENVKEAQAKAGNQYQEDMKASKEERVQKFRKGFLKKFNE